MASDLRKRLAKRAATPDIKAAMSSHAVSDEHSKENTIPKRPSERGYKPIAQNDMSTTPPPPPERKDSAHSQKYDERSGSPSQSLLFRYKNRIATNHHILTTSAKLPAAFARATGRDTTLREQFQVDHPPVTPESKQTQQKYAAEPIGVTRVYDGVKFEMMSAQKSGEVSGSTSPNEGASSERRQTRSQTRRQERIDSHKAPSESNGGKESHGLTIRQVFDVERAVSPLAHKHEHDLADTGLTPTSTASIHSPQDQLALSSPTATNSVTSDASPSLTSLDSEVMASTPKISSYRKSQQAKASHIQPIEVKPPKVAAGTPPGFVWTSNVGSSSMPSEPWGWLKKWTCCQCGVLDPNGKGNSAETMVEQRICSRLECGHERCPLGCMILRG